MSSHLDNKDTAPLAPPGYSSLHRPNAPTALAISSDTNWVASGFQDGTIRLIYVPNASTSVHQASKNPIRALAFSSSDPPHLACADSADRLTAWRIHRSQPTRGAPALQVALERLAPSCRGPGCFPAGDEHILALAWSADSTQIAACYQGGYLFRWYPTTGGQTFDWFGGDDSAFPLAFAVFSPDSRLLAYGGADGRCHIWNVERRALQATLKADPESPILGAQFSSAPGASRIVTWCSAHHARTWNTSSGALLEATPAHSAPVHSAALHRDGKLLTALDNGYAVLWGAGCTSFYPLRGASAARVNSVCFSPGGAFIASAGSDGAVCLWEACDVTGPPTVFTKHGGEAMLVAFSGDGAVLVSAATDGSVHIGRTPVADSRLGRESIVRRMLPGLRIGRIFFETWIRTLAMVRDGSTRLPAAEGERTVLFSKQPLLYVLSSLEQPRPRECARSRRI
ncbi:hypothetical protein VTO73DRAFT_11610 [Trametes versicolor]